MTDKVAQPNHAKGAEFATAATPKQLMEQLITMMGDGQPQPSSDSNARIDALEARLEALQGRMTEASATNGGGVSGEELAQKLKSLISSALLESGFLEKFVKSTVDKRLQAVLEEVLPKQVAKICESAIGDAVPRHVNNYLSSEDMKVLLDEKFRAVTLYMKTDVIPSAVRHALKGIQTTA